MENFNFIATNSLDLDNLREVDRFVDSFPDFQTVILNNADELKKLLNLMGFDGYDEQKLSSPYFSKYWDLSSRKFPDLDGEQFDCFYEKWLEISNRKNNMDEYGNLVFLRGRSSFWNRLKYRLVVKEKVSSD